MAYNLQSLITILEQILDPQQKQWIVDHNKPQLQSLLKKSSYLKQILENSSLSKTETIESQICSAAHEAEDIIESHMVDQMLSTPGGVSFAFTTPDLHQVFQELDCVTEKVVKLCSKSVEVGFDENLLQLKDRLTGMQTNLESIPAVEMASVPKATLDDLQKVMQQLSSAMEQVEKLMEEKTTTTTTTPSSRFKTVAVVGIDEDLKMLKKRLTSQSRKLEIVPILGKGGIGKTTLARKLYEDSSIVSHFEYGRAWTTVSRDYNLRAIVLGLLRCIIGKEVDQHTKKRNDHLKDILYQSLSGRKYLIVLDDIWSTKFWDEIRSYFPDSNNGSRIVITTRQSVLAKFVGPQSKQHQMQLLNSLESCNLLRQEVFGDENSPAELEEIGRNIARNCGGLPLAIHVIAGILPKASTTIDLWENVAKDVKLVAASAKDKVSDILSLSYHHLHPHLKPCLLYMGAFPEDYEIKASKLVRLWAAEGFLTFNGNKSLEEEAEDCLQDLLRKNLVFVRALKSNGQPKSYGMHDLMRDLCIKKAEEQRFVHVGSKQSEELTYRLRRVSLYPSYRVGDKHVSKEYISMIRSFLCTSLPSHFTLSALQLLRVLDIFEMRFQRFPTGVLDLVNLRYLAFCCDSTEVPSGISRLCNLQTLALRSRYHITLPPEIWEMAELRHVIVHKSSFYIRGHDSGTFTHKKLQTVSAIRDPSDGFLHRIPEMKVLGIFSSHSNFDLCHLQKLERFKLCQYSDNNLLSSSRLRLPHSLRELSLKGCAIGGEFMDHLCELPNLEVLKLQECKFEGGELQKWELDATKQKLHKLQFLLLERLQLVQWQAEEANFPRLQRLVIRGCSALENIPSGVGKIPTLQTIKLDECSHSFMASAALIIKERHELDNNELQLCT